MLMIFAQLSPVGVLLRILVYKMWPFMRLISLFVIRRDCLLGSRSSELSPVLQIAVVPLEVDVPRHVNLDDRAVPLFALLRIVIADVVFEQLDAIFANGRCKQLAEVCQGIMKVFRFA